MAVRQAKKPNIRNLIAIVRPRFKPFKTTGRPYVIRGRLKRGCP
ncbi:MAG: hypothetical protein ABFD47_08305 [Armatimonadota bacterium]